MHPRIPGSSLPQHPHQWQQQYRSTGGHLLQGQQRVDLSSSPLIPGIEARPLQPNPAYYKSASLARSRNSVAPPAALSASASTSFSPQQFFELDKGSRAISGGGSEYESTPSLTSSTANTSSRKGMQLSQQQYQQQQQMLPQRRLIDSGGSSGHGEYGNGGVGSGGSLDRGRTRVQGIPGGQQGKRTKAGATVTTGNANGISSKAMGPRPVNYNNLMRREQEPQRQDSMKNGTHESPHTRVSYGSGSGGADGGNTNLQKPPPNRSDAGASTFPPADPRSKLLAYGPTPATSTDAYALPSSPSITIALATTGHLNGISNANSSAAGRSSSGGGFMEGPLPAEVRAIITKHFSSAAGGAGDFMVYGVGGGATDAMTAVEEAERQARRLLSTGRRVRVYRDELVAAQEETVDLAGSLEQHALVVGALEHEMSDIDAKIAQLTTERELCDAQLQQQRGVAARQQEKLAQAEERVTVLRNTIDNITREAQAGQMVLRQLVPELNINNYV